MNKPHKFFDVILDNDVNELFDYLVTMESKIIDENILGLSDAILKKYERRQGMMTLLGIKDYNIFNFVHPSIYNLHTNLRELTKTACEYYDINFNSEKYLIHGWYNLDYKSEGAYVSPIKEPNRFHDHSDGLGAPWFHGYYCVNAEPSSTFYKINKNDVFENININNRAIISETGHPHGRDDWFKDKPRITIAYDITPMNKLIGVNPNIWCPL